MSRIWAGAPASKSSWTMYRPTKSSCKSHFGHFKNLGLSPVMFADEPVSVDRCFATICRGGDGLSVSEISYISSRKYSRNVRFSFIMGDNVAFGVEVHLSLEYCSVWFVSDCH